MKPKRNYTVSIRVASTRLTNTWHTYTYTTMNCSSKASACNKAFKHWIANGHIRSQPKMDLDSPSGFRDVRVKIF